MKSVITDDSKIKNKQTVVVGMSGGVDSSVVALLLKLKGYNVVGLHMKSSNEDSSDDDEKTVIELCENMGIKLHVVNYQDEMQLVKDYFINEYLAGRTPNPCVVCNKEVKFKPFIDFANKIGADFFATGHYARIEHKNGKHTLMTAIDSQKDQTYFLSKLSQSQLEKAIFPLGELTKPEVRQIAEDNGLVSSHKKDSFDVCFVGSSKFKDYMDKIHPEKAGNIVDVDSGKVVGRHGGISKYTLGQRKGLGIGGGHGTSGDCWFVVKKDIKNNILYVAQGNDDALYSDALISNEFNWMPIVPEQKEFECFAKFRYRQNNQAVKVKVLDGGAVQVDFVEKQRAITPGQYVVLYQRTEKDDVYACLGGGTIDVVIKDGKMLDL